ncbi:MAG: hypothetical protein V4537_18180 [Pseudomonadota bacterium]
MSTDPVDLTTPVADPRVAAAFDSLKSMSRPERDLRSARVVAMLTEAAREVGKQRDEIMRLSWKATEAETSAEQAEAKSTKALDATRDIHTALRIVRRILGPPDVFSVDGKPAPDLRDDAAYLRGLIDATVVVIQAVV